MKSILAAFSLVCAITSADIFSPGLRPFNGTNKPLLRWENWGGNQVCAPAALIRPTSEDEIVAAVRASTQSGRRIRVVGAGHSFSPLVLTDDILMSLDDYASLVSVDSEALTVTAEAGMRVHVLNNLLEQRGLALANTGAIAQQSLAGATQTSTHGTGTNLGSMATQIVGMRIVIANGTILDLAPGDPLLNATRVAVGVLGVVSQVTLSVRPAFRLRRTTTVLPLASLLPQLPALRVQYPRLQYYWTPLSANATGGTLLATLLLREPTTDPITGCWPDTLHRLAAISRGQDEEALRVLAAGGNVTSDCVDVSYKALTHETDDVTLYTEMEQFVAIEDEMPLLHKYSSFQESVRAKHDPQTTLFTGVRYVAGDHIWISPMFGRDTAVFSQIAFGTDSTATVPSQFALFAKGLQAAAAGFTGRPHWGKMNWTPREELDRVYPRLPDFRALRSTLDPQGLFLNDYTTYVFE